MALTIAQCFYSIRFTVKYNVLFGPFKFGLGIGLNIKVLASFNISAKHSSLPLNGLT